MNQIIKGWKTTVLGIIIILTSLAALFFTTIAWQGLATFLLLGIMLLFTPDNLLNIAASIIKKFTGGDPPATP